MGCGKSSFRSIRTCYKRYESLHWRLRRFSYEEKWSKNSYLLLEKIRRTLSLWYLFWEIYSINDKEIHFVKWNGYALIGNQDHTDVTSTYHEYFFIHNELFSIILETDQNSDISLKVIHKEVSLSSINDNSTYSKSKLSSRSEIVSSCHQLQRTRQKKFMIIHRNWKTISSWLFLIHHQS